jgi:hypothetical protein
MFTYAHQHHLHFPDLLRWSGRACGLSLVVAWLVLVIIESVRSGPFHSAQLLYQAAALAVVFAGYAIGWRSELTGGVLSIVGTIAFFLASAVSVGVLPPLGAAWFAVPGVLYLLAWLADERRRATRLSAVAKRASSKPAARGGSISTSRSP